jgi:hypothetical protein
VGGGRAATPRAGPIALAAAAAVIALLVPALTTASTAFAPTRSRCTALALSSWLLVTAVIDGCRRWQRPPAFSAVAVASFWTYSSTCRWSCCSSWRPRLHPPADRVRRDRRAGAGRLGSDRCAHRHTALGGLVA